MESMALAQIAAAVGGQVEPEYAGVRVDSVTIDSRRADGGWTRPETGNRDHASLFVALKGERHDGHDFTDSFLAGGGTAALVEHPVDGPCVVVTDACRALGDLARHYRAQFDVPVVGVTGSVGKTSTRGMIASVLNTAGTVCSTAGNLNNAIGVPLTLLGLLASDRFAVVEMGMDHLGEMRYLTNIVRPTIAVITNIGTAHIANLGSRAAILQAKLEILEGLSPDGLVVLNGDDKLLRSASGDLKFRVRYYGVNDANGGIRAQDVDLRTTESRFSVDLEDRRHRFRVPAPGAHHIGNALAAITVGIECGIAVDDIKRGIENFTPEAMRQIIDVVHGVRIIEDCYNAGPESMKAALDVLALTAENGHKIAVLGDMLELGDFSAGFHREVGEYAVATHVDTVVAVGEDAELIAEAAESGGVPAHHLTTNAEAVALLTQMVAPGDTVLIKASHGMKFEEIAQGLRAALA